MDGLRRAFVGKGAEGSEVEVFDRYSAVMVSSSVLLESRADTRDMLYVQVTETSHCDS